MWHTQSRNVQKDAKLSDHAVSRHCRNFELWRQSVMKCKLRVNFHIDVNQSPSPRASVRNDIKLGRTSVKTLSHETYDDQKTIYCSNFYHFIEVCLFFPVFLFFLQALTHRFTMTLNYTKRTVKGA